MDLLSAHQRDGIMADTAAEIIEAERLGDTLVLTPKRNLRELDFQEVEKRLRGVVQRLKNDPSIRHLVVDFARTDQFGSTALGLLVRLRRQVRERGGRMVFCNLSDHAREILAVTRLEDFWPAFATRREAIDAVRPVAPAA
jgi:Ca-activated chloride channel family protein